MATSNVLQDSKSLLQQTPESLLLKSIIQLGLLASRQQEHPTDHPGGVKWYTLGCLDRSG